MSLYEHWNENLNHQEDSDDTLELGYIFDAKTHKKVKINPKEILGKIPAVTHVNKNEVDSVRAMYRIRGGFITQKATAILGEDTVANVKKGPKDEMLQASTVIIGKNKKPRLVTTIGFEKVEGESFGKSKLSLEKLLPATLTVAKALQKYEENGWVHCDIQPENIMWESKKATPVLIDFEFSNSIDGLKEYNGESKNLGYSSPERLAEETEDTRSEIFSLTMTLLGSLNLPKEAVPALYELEDSHIYFENLPTEKYTQYYKKLLGNLQEQVLDTNKIPEKLKVVIAKNISPEKEDREERWKDFIKELEMCEDPTKELKDIEKFIAENDSYKERRAKRMDIYENIITKYQTPTIPHLRKLITMTRVGNMVNASSAIEATDITENDIDTIFEDANIRRHLKEDQINIIEVPHTTETLSKLETMESYLEKAGITKKEIQDKVKDRQLPTLTLLLGAVNGDPNETRLGAIVNGVIGKYPNPEDFLREISKRSAEKFQVFQGTDKYKNLSTGDLKEIILEEQALIYFMAETLYGKRFEYQMAYNQLLNNSVETLEILQEQEALDSISFDLEASLLDLIEDTPDVIVVGEKHNLADTTSAEDYITLLEKLRDIGTDVGFLGIELTTLDREKLSEGGKRYLDCMKPLIDRCEQLNIPVIRIAGDEQDPGHQDFENSIASKIATAKRDFGKGIVILGGMHARKTDTTGTYKVTTAVGVMQRNKLNIKSIMYHRLREGDPGNQLVEDKGTMAIQKPNLVDRYKAPQEEQQQLEKVIGPNKKNDFDMIILAPSIIDFSKVQRW